MNISLYKDIENILKVENGTCEINNLCFLKKWTVNRNNKKIDVLTLEFYAINGRRYVGIYTINSRDFNGVLNEIKSAINDGLQEINDRLIKDINAGYR